MITLTRRQIKSIRSVFRRALGLTSKSAAVSVLIAADDSGGFVRIHRHEVAVEYRFHADNPADTIVVPISILADCEAARDGPVTFSRQPDNTVLVEWRHKDVPIVRTADPPEFGDGFPAMPATMQEQPVEFLPALQDTMATIQRDATRYAINCVQLCGATGRLLATDSRQALVVAGFEFPWDDALLLPFNAVFGLKELKAQESIQIGRNDNRLTFCAGPWTLHFALETEGRFPNIDDVIPNVDDAGTTLCVSEDDAEFAVQSIRELPQPEFDESVTVDLNGAVAIRAKADGPATELVLRNSRHSGEAFCFTTDRRLLARALQLGFREFRLTNPEHVIVSRRDDRTFVWMPLAPTDAVQPGQDCVRLESPAGSTVPPASSPRLPSPRPSRRRKPAMAKTRTPQTNGRNGQDNNNAGQSGIDALIASAETLKTSLRETLNAVGALIGGLKQHRQQTKKLRSAMLSLKQLQALDA